MKEFKKILFPVDISESSAKIVPYVQALAKKFESQIHLLFVARTYHYFTNMYVPSSSIIQFETEVIMGSQKRLDEFISQFFSEFPTTQKYVVAGDPAEQIISFITDNQIDLIIMGTHGRKGMEKIIFGSVADRVVKTSPVPVMVINPYK
ncbi:MAG: universal stress protein [Deltaproteobacteria bacterium]|nr:universal stress protein [Deltaproteobacteria bacterium]